MRPHTYHPTGKQAKKHAPQARGYSCPSGDLLRRAEAVAENVIGIEFDGADIGLHADNAWVRVATLVDRHVNSIGARVDRWARYAQRVRARRSAVVRKRNQHRVNPER